jgi:hypothetical protein
MKYIDILINRMMNQMIQVSLDHHFFAPLKALGPWTDDFQQCWRNGQERADRQHFFSPYRVICNKPKRFEYL